jgi:ribosomal protein S18 acetylase RimI-like enzyme
MSDLPEYLFADPVRHALGTRHRDFAVSAGDALRYPAEVAPFASVAAPTTAALNDLHSLLQPGESVWIPGPAFPQAPGLRRDEILECVQMVLPLNATLSEPASELKRMSGADAPAMVELTDLAFPGFFRSQTYRMGTYYGSYLDGRLVAMGGERLRIDGYSEMSGICTHPGFRGKGLAAGIIWRLAHDHRREGVVSWLHVSAGNRAAIALYDRLGFQQIRRILMNRMSRLPTT